MAEITFHGNPLNTSGGLPAAGQPAPDFTLTGGDLGAVTSEGLRGGRVVLNIFPSIDTPVCAQSVRTFNEAGRWAGGHHCCVRVGRSAFRRGPVLWRRGDRERGPSARPSATLSSWTTTGSASLTARSPACAPGRWW